MYGNCKRTQTQTAAATTIAAAHVDQMANESIIITATMSFTIP